MKRACGQSRVLMLNHTSDLSGAELSLLALAEGLPAKGFRPRLAAPREGRFLDEARARGLEAEVVRLAPARLRRPVGFFNGTVRLARMLRRHEADLLHANSFAAVKQACLASRMAGVPLVGHVRDIVPFTALTRRAVFSCRRVVCVSEATARHLCRGAPRRTLARVRVVYNGVDLAALEAGDGDRAAHALGLESASRPRVGMIAPLVPWKGHRVLLDAARRISASGLRVTWIVVGDTTFSGPGYARELEALAASPELSGRVHFVGFRRDVADILAWLDVVVCPSVEPDPLPRAMLEAMAAGRPVVGTATGGIPEAIRDGENGRLVAPGDAAALAEAITALVADPDRTRCLGREARRTAERRFSIERHLAGMVAVFREALGNGGAEDPGRVGATV